jgi:hypothetical protein
MKNKKQKKTLITNVNLESIFAIALILISL